MTTVLHEVGSVVHQQEWRVHGARRGDSAEQVVEELVSRGVVAGRYVDVRYQVDRRVSRYADAVAILELEAASLRCSGEWT